MNPYLLGQCVFHFVKGLVLSPPSHVSDSSAGFSLTINPSFLRLKQHDQLIFSTLLSSLHGCDAPCERLSYLALCLAHS
jgi:hypothetical protein